MEPADVQDRAPTWDFGCDVKENMPLSGYSNAAARILAESRDHDGPDPLLLVPPGDAESLADALRRLHQDPHEYSNTGNAGADYYRRSLSDVAIRQSLQQMIGSD